MNSTALGAGTETVHKLILSAKHMRNGLIQNTYQALELTFIQKGQKVTRIQR